jgi:hypothetical protein
MKTIGIMLVLVMAQLSSMARAEQNQFWLAAQHDWGAMKGFFLTVANEYPTGQLAQLSAAKLTLGVGDGSNWHYLSHEAKWELNKPYRAKAVITASAVELWLDGVQVARQDLRFVAAPRPVAFSEQPSFLRGPAEYTVRQAAFRASAGSQIERTLDASKLPVQLRLLNPAAGAGREELAVTDHVTVEADFAFESVPNLRALAPFIDRFGQSVHADWPGKVRDESELRAAHDEEQKRLAEWPAPDRRDAFGGLTDAGWKQQATGFYTTIKPRSGMGDDAPFRTRVSL